MTRYSRRDDAFPAMLYTAIDYHRKYSVVRTEDATGNRVCSARIDQNEPAAFAGYFAGLPEPSRVVLEACWGGRRGRALHVNILGVYVTMQRLTLKPCKA